jgi:hypothetical protein
MAAVMISFVSLGREGELPEEEFIACVPDRHTLRLKTRWMSRSASEGKE